jgi:subtilisin family serine protease
VKKRRRRPRHNRRQELQGLAKGIARKRRVWTFEKLEDRHFLSATPFTSDAVASYSNSTPEGAQQILLSELLRSLRQYNSGSSAESAPVTTYALPNDPYLQDQWHLLNLGQLVSNPDQQEILATPGQDINVVGAWELGYTGSGVVVAVVDTGTELDHPDLAANIDLDAVFNAITGTSDQGNLQDPHGTAVAGLIGAVGDNGVGMTGVAYNSTLVPILFLPNGNEEDALRHESQLIDIYNNSWGPNRNLIGRQVYSIPNGPSPLVPDALDAIRDGINFGRDGLGSIYVFSSGNSAAPQIFGGQSSSANYSEYINSRYTIGVTGVDHDGKYNNFDGSVTNYMEGGASVLVAAPTGSFSIQVGEDTGIGSGIWTTDFTGEDGYNESPLPNGNELDVDFFEDIDYTSRFNGTSASAPIVSGVIALMLEANPNLTWRDVQEILVRSARQTDLEDPSNGGELENDLTWIVNRRDLFRAPQSINQALPVVTPIDVVDHLYSPDPIVSALTNPNNPFWDPTFDPNNQPFPTGTLLVPGLAYSEPDLSAMPPVFGGMSVTNVYAPPWAPMFTNGAGYTVSDGRGAYGETYGYGHGVVDAELAVQLARQWTIQGQALPEEATFTTFVSPQGGRTIRAAVVGNDATGNILIPGAATASDDAFAPFWEEYAVDDDPASPDDGPFSAYSNDADPGDRGGFYYFEVPDSEAMTVEWVEVEIDITGTADDLDYLRIVLVSPDGTHSELNTYFDHATGTEPTSQTPRVSGLLVDPPGAISATDNFVWTFSTNRNWGERSDNQPVINPLTTNPFTNATPLDVSGQPMWNTPGLPVLDTGGLQLADGTAIPGGNVVERGWQLYFENYSTSEFDINSLNLTWHGSPIDAATERVRGMVGVDAGSGGVGASDGAFAFSNYSLKTEPGAANVTVVATRVSDGVVVDKFITGADGNFYFDLLPDEYIITVEDPDGRDALDEAGVPANSLPLYQQQWHITSSWFNQPMGVSENVVVPNLPDRPFGLAPYNFSDDLGSWPWPDNTTSFFQNFRVQADANGDPVPFTDAQGQYASGPKYLNFLLDAGPIPANEVVVSGEVFADLNGDGIDNNDDAPGVDFVVYADINQSGQFEATDPFTLTDHLGQYTLTIPTGTTEVFNIGAVPPTPNWVQTFPATTFTPVLGGPGAAQTNVKFGFEPIIIEPPPVPQPGSILGVVYNDANGNGIREAGETGVSGFHVYVDVDNSESFDAGEPEAFTGPNGAYFLADVDPGFVAVKIDVSSPWVATNPASATRVVNLPSAGIVTNTLFGIRNTATNDWGDLPDQNIAAVYRYDVAPDGTVSPPNHFMVAGFTLGTIIDGEVGSQPSINADGDDAVSGDEDGVLVLDQFGNPDPTRTLRPGILASDPQANKLRVTVNGVGGLLTGWIDFNGDGDFQDAGEKLTWENPSGSLVTEVDINPGTYDLPITVPSFVKSGLIAARFRWGPAGLDYYGGASIGEVEDYWFDPPAVSSGGLVDGDYDGSGTVDEDDFLMWRSNYGTIVTPGTGADGNGNGVIDSADYTVWRDNMGATSGGGGAAASQSAQSSTATSTAAREVSPEDWQRTVEEMATFGYEPITVRVGLNGSRVLWRSIVTASPSPSSTQTAGVVTSGLSSTVVPLGFSIDLPGGDLGRESLHAATISRIPDSVLAVHSTAPQTSLDLLDQVLAGFVPVADDASDADDDSLLFGVSEEDEHAADLALAAAFNEEENWRTSI